MTFIDEYRYRDCPWCNTQSVAMDIILNQHQANDSKGVTREWSVLSCPRCRGVLAVETKVGSRFVLQVVPRTSAGLNEVKHLPDDVQEYFMNAQTVLRAGVPSAAAVELRRTLEAAAQHQGVHEKTLVKSIQKLAEQGLVTNTFVDVLGHIRKVGNTGAHASDQKLSSDEVQSALAFTTQVLKNLFEIPKELEMLGAPESEAETETEAEAEIRLN